MELLERCFCVAETERPVRRNGILRAAAGGANRFERLVVRCCA
jgi:hypothetical protein